MCRVNGAVYIIGLGSFHAKGFMSTGYGVYVPHIFNAVTGNEVLFTY